MRKLGIVAAIIVVLLVAAALIVPHLVDINQYHGQIQSQLEKKLGRQVSLGNMSLSMFPPSFQVENTTMAKDTGSPLDARSPQPTSFPSASSFGPCSIRMLRSTLLSWSILTLNSFARR